MAASPAFRLFGFPIHVRGGFLLFLALVVFVNGGELGLWIAGSAAVLTLLHELGHATGHVSRLGRDLSGSFGSKKYAFEELVAEINAAFCCASLGTAPTVRHADYIGSWLEVLREDNRAIVRAASQASKAADWLLGHLLEPTAAADAAGQGRAAA